MHRAGKGALRLCLHSRACCRVPVHGALQAVRVMWLASLPALARSADAEQQQRATASPAACWRLPLLECSPTSTARVSQAAGGSGSSLQPRKLSNALCASSTWRGNEKHADRSRPASHSADLGSIKAEGFLTRCYRINFGDCCLQAACGRQPFPIKAHPLPDRCRCCSQASGRKSCSSRPLVCSCGQRLHTCRCMLLTSTLHTCCRIAASAAVRPDGGRLQPKACLQPRHLACSSRILAIC